ncbi:MerR family transcriptional regulator [Dactylosporangium sp. AC04546]|uniref:MerR family transcriptional regulator n=1 Tax=Dactylosporangium sp. AC04546 TaxID=2862460 RepID=UPI001EDDE7CC|nr:MerR family transcriptional regulator [Dactylosporangium sp. AC04546]WVK83720.1 MerR family transcriptional regulator [Dactylosporangium sp. AC04546]
MSAAAAYSAGAVARRLGVAVTTLRTWHQRYGMGPSLHEPGHHRRYTEQDIERLQVMQRLIFEGVAPSEAARWANRPPISAPLPSSSETDAGSLVRGLLRAAMRLDAPAVRQRVTHAVQDLGVVAAWDAVLAPVLVAIGERYEATGAYVEVEHLLSGCVSAVLGSVPRPSADVPVRTLLACADEEQHSLPIEALAAALASCGVPARVLGARVPTAALIAAIRRTGPAAVLVWSHLPSTSDPVQLSAVLAERARPVVLAAAGGGWDESALPEGVLRPGSLTDALVILTSASNGSSV